MTIGVDDRHAVSIERSEEAVGASTDAAADHGSEGVRATEIARRGSRRGRGRRGDSLGVRRCGNADRSNGQSGSSDEARKAFVVDELHGNISS